MKEQVDTFKSIFDSSYFLGTEAAHDCDIVGCLSVKAELCGKYQLYFVLPVSLGKGARDDRK